MQELIDAVAEATGWPASMVERSARARAQAEGATVEAVLAAWAGGGAIEAGAGAADDSAPVAESAPAAAAPAAVAAPVEPELEVEVLETTPAEAEPEAEPEPRKRPTVPTWLAASFALLPAIAIMYALFFPNGPGCGVGAQLGVDPVTGEAESCDGAPYGQTEFDYFAAGEETYASFCSACHGANGAGSGNFPALSGGSVAATFPSCGDHIEWVALGTLGWPDATYGANATPVGSSGAVMPSFGGSFTPEQLAAVVVFERVAFGALSLDEVTADCAPGELTAASE
ncbi:MAG: cytochrome c [Acidimicrobiia bacterium]|nr:cytochrome c [Acidimicrobiia bacterium]